MGTTSLPISIFAQPPRGDGKPYSFAVSAVAHVAVAGLILYGFIFAPRIDVKSAADRYTLRQVELDDPPQIERPRPAGDDSRYPKPESAAKAEAQHEMPAAPSSSIRQIPKLHIADKTLVQPDVPDNLLVIKHTPMPSVLLWNAQQPKVQLIAPPPPQKIAWVNTKPVLTRPTAEPQVSDVPVTSTPFNSKLPMPTPASSTPIAVIGPDLKDRLPQTSSASSIQPTAAAMMSISEEQLAKGTIALPPVNQTAAGNESGAMRPGKSGNSAEGGTGDPSSKGSATGAPHSQGSQGHPSGAAGTQLASNAGGSNAGNAGSGTGSTMGGNGGLGIAPSFAHISLPQAGGYGVVVVDSTIADEYPQTAQLWGGRIVYSVYLHVGLAHSWILQYSLPPSKETTAANLNHVDAPWPFYIVRPNTPVDGGNADALMVHGFVNENGHFEALGVVFPPTVHQTQYLLAGLEQWKFRPAKHNGQAARVEVLLIIPLGVD